MGATSKEVEEALFDKFQNDDESAFTEIFRKFEQLTLSQVGMMSSNYKHLQPDLKSDVRLILWNAAKNFDPAKGRPFRAYLKRCVKNAISQKIKKHYREGKHLEEYCHQSSIKFVVDPTSDGDCEIPVTDPFPFHDEPILSELMPFCKPEELAILGLICNDDEVWHKNGNLNNAAIARKLGISREAVRRIVRNLGTKQSLRHTISELTPR